MQQKGLNYMKPAIRKARCADKSGWVRAQLLEQIQLERIQKLASQEAWIAERAVSARKY